MELIMLILKNVLYYLFPDLQLVLYNADAVEVPLYGFSYENPLF